MLNPKTTSRLHSNPLAMKKFISIAAVSALCATMLPTTALAAATDGPYVTGASIADAIAKTDFSGNLYLTAPSSMNLAGKTFTLTTDEAVSFVSTTAPESGELYASAGSSTSATLKFNVTGFDTDSYNIGLTSADGQNWSGAFSDGFNATFEELGQAMNTLQGSMHPGMMQGADGSLSQTWNIYANFDAANTQLVICDPAAEMAEVTYDFGSGEYTWELPVGAPLSNVDVPDGIVVQGWYTDSDFTEGNEVDFVNDTVPAGGLTLYAELEQIPATSGFLQGLNNEDEILYIQNTTDFEDFVTNGYQVTEDQLVVLTEDLNLNGESYSAINFNGSFDGRGHTISNAEFTPNNGYAGLFSELDGNQVIANLNLDSITASGSLFSSSGYAGVLAGNVYGNAEGNRMNLLIQNVHVTNSTVSGYTAGGLVGFSFPCTIQYCSVEDTQVTGLANAGGISGLTYADINACYSDGMSLTALQSRGRGGIAGKILESGNVTNCWYSYSGNEGPAGEISVDGYANNNIISSSGSFAWTMWNRGQSVWNLGTNSASFIPEAVEYTFENLG